MVNFDLWDKILEELNETYINLCGKNNVIFDKDIPTSLCEIDKLEKELNSTLPTSFKETLLNFSKNLQLYVSLPDTLELPDNLAEIFSAYFLISIDEIKNAENSRIEWIDSCFNNIEDEYDKIWHNKLGFMTVGNGDVVAFDLDDKKEDKKVVYLSHDGSESHGIILGENFYEYFENLLLIGGCGNEDWQITPFISGSKGIDYKSENAILYRELISLKLMK